MPEARGTAGSTRASRYEAGLRLLIIDPNPMSRSRLKETLRGIEGVGAISERASPHALLEILSETPVDVIMIDQEPGVGDVYDIVRLVHSKPVGKAINFVLMGDHLGQEATRKGGEAGIRGFLAKPFDIRGLEKALADAAPRRTAEAPRTAPAHGGEGRDHFKETLDKLRQVSIFTGFTDAELVRLLRICKGRNIAEGQYVFHEGEKGDSLYVIVSGRIEIRKQIDGVDKVLVKMRPGDCFGEIAIIDSKPRSADAVAATDCTVIEVNESLVNNNEDILSLKLVRQIAILLARKLRDQSR